LKTTSYAENVVALARAQEEGADEALFGNTAGNLCEGTGTNIFVVVDDRLVTPPLSSGCLAGVTRELLLEVDTSIAEADVPLTRLPSVEEAFLTSSTRDVMPISAIDGRALREVDGPHTRRASSALRELQARTFDP
jgi:branched-chain amino acid aminotransferase